jgi:hypothetical protein
LPRQKNKEKWQKNIEKEAFQIVAKGCHETIQQSQKPHSNYKKRCNNYTKIKIEDIEHLCA